MHSGEELQEALHAHKTFCFCGKLKSKSHSAEKNAHWKVEFIFYFSARNKGEWNKG